MSRRTVSNLVGLVGAAVGGLLGFFLYGMLLRRGLYGPMLPGALLGLGCGLLARHVSTARGVACGVASLALGLLSDWYWHGFDADPSLGYYLSHLGDLDQGWWAYLMLALGAALGYWWGRASQFGDRTGPARPV